MNTRLEQDHQVIKRHVRPMLGFQTVNTARVIPIGIELAHMIVNGRRNMPAIGIYPSPSVSPAQRMSTPRSTCRVLVHTPNLRRNRLTSA